MKISMSVMIVLTTLFCVLPYLWFIIVGKNSSKKHEKLFQDVINKENMSFNIKEQWNNNFIGLDESQNTLLFIKLVKQEATFYKIDLDQLKSCQINRKAKEFKKENKWRTELQSVDLELEYVSKNEIVTLHLYNINDRFTEDMEMKRAEKWQSVICQNKHIVILNKKAA